MTEDVWMWLLLATGFTGGLTFVFLFRRLYHWLVTPLSLAVYFSPKGGCQEAMVREIQRARREILVQAYSFTADPLTYGLVDAKKRGVNVEILLDRSNEQEQYSDLRILLDQGLAPLIDAKHAIAHNKVMIIDQRVVVTGSYNFTNQAENENAENVVIIKGNRSLIQSYRANFLEHKSHCQAAQLKTPAAPQRKAA